MILTPIHPDHLPALIDRFAATLTQAESHAVFRRIAESGGGARVAGAMARAHHRDALRVLTELGMATRPGPPSLGFSWDGHAARSATEAYVLLHEAAHFQLAAPDRRRRIDFGLGPGPETGSRGEAERNALLFGLAREREEALASLLGVLWEVELGHPALASFLDQNWLEGVGRPGTATHFSSTLAELRAGGFITAEGRPTLRLRELPDPT